MSSYNFKSISGVRFFSSQEIVNTPKTLITLKLEARVSGQLENVCSPVEKKTIVAFRAQEGVSF